MAKAESIFTTLALRGDRVRLLNRPSRVLRRYDLLRLLHAKGLNDDNAFMAENPRVAAVGERLRSYHDIFAKPKKARRRRANPTNGGAHIG